MKMSFFAGILAGAAVGAAVTMLMDPVSDRQRRQIKRGTGRMFRTMGSIVDDVIESRCR